MSHLKRRTKRCLLLFLLGALLGPVGDFYHVITQTLSYPPEVFRAYFFGMPFWTPFLFGGATFTIGISHSLVDRWTRKRGERKPKRLGAKNTTWAILNGASLYVLYVGSGFLPWPAGGIPDVLLGAGAIAIWFFFDRTALGFVLAAATGLIGALVEAFLVSRGAFFYYPHAANFLGVPSWLPWIYFSASIATANVARLFNPLASSILEDKYGPR